MKPNNKMLYFEAPEDLHQQIAATAKLGGRTISREIQRRLWATLQNPDWEHPVVDHEGALIRKGWIAHYDPRYGGNVLLPPGTVTEALGKITGTLAASESADTASITAESRLEKEKMGAAQREWMAREEKRKKKHREWMAAQKKGKEEAGPKKKAGRPTAA